MITSWAPTPLIMSKTPIPVRLISPSLTKAGNRLLTILTSQPAVLGAVLGSLQAVISGGVFASFPRQNGHLAPPSPASSETEGILKSVGRCPRSDAITIQRSEIGSFLNSGIFLTPH